MEENQVQSAFWERPTIKYGLIGGIITSLIYAIYYFFNEALFGHPFWSSFPLIIMLFISILAGVEKKKSCEVLAFGNALATVFGAFMIALLINTAFMLILFFIIDPALPDRMMEVAREKLANGVESGKYPKESIETLDSAVEKTGTKRMMLFQSIGSLLFFGAIGLIVSLIAAAFLRKGPKY